MFWISKMPNPRRELHRTAPLEFAAGSMFSGDKPDAVPMRQVFDSRPRKPLILLARLAKQKHTGCAKSVTDVLPCTGGDVPPLQDGV
ncbi:MAG: hypothetical protein AUH71_02340 [Thaumarchaeota archaeon 13_1_40CM_4_48_7]|nr:MAG: hypothetical protein AUH71_02340 [Thaumarchaeota archaeon 13_1_40CM_4_48_7]